VEADGKFTRGTEEESLSPGKEGGIGMSKLAQPLSHENIFLEGAGPSPDTADSPEILLVERTHGVRFAKAFLFGSLVSSLIWAVIIFLLSNL